MQLAGSVIAESPTLGLVFYVDTNGDDNNPGTIDQPWRTIHHAAEMMMAGDTVFIRDGVYKEQVSTVNDGNSANGYIVFSAYPGETPILDGTNVTKIRDACFLITHSYIKLSGLEICNWEQGIWVEKGGHIEISECEVHDVWYGVGVADGAHDFVFNRCVVYDVFDGFDVSARNTMLNCCAAYNCWNGGYKIWQDNVTLINCLSYHNAISNVELDWDGDSGTTTLINCHFVDSQEFNVWVENSNDHLHMYNCILACGDNIGLAFEQTGTTNYQGDYNIFHNDDSERAIVVGYEDEFSLTQIAAGDWTGYSSQDQHSVVSFNPESDLFVDLSNWDLHLSNQSIAINARTSENAPSFGYDGTNRPQGEGYDIGAYEIPEFPSLLILLPFMFVLAVIVYRKKLVMQG